MITTVSGEPSADESRDRSRSSDLLGDGLGGESDAWLSRLRGRLRLRLFGSGDGHPRALADTMNAGKPAEPADSKLPGRIGRYRVVGRIGSGGMGVIYAASDDALGRKVAVKLLRAGGLDVDARGRARLQREAQALARLSHPSVISVYEVGEHEQQVFIAMEFVEGDTLRRWQTRTDLSWRAVLRAYLAAGRGLAAAHAAGIVHRDFKPDNVLIGRDGQVRVIDFGLARTDLDPGLTPPPSQLPHDRPSEEPLTRTGALMGTPAYMAPEQFRGESAGAHTDQFAFCIALWEALHGFRPFAGATVGQLANAVLQGRREAPPRYTDVPDRVHRVLARGLALQPEDRFATLEVLIDELSVASTRTTRWIWGGVSLALLGTVGLGSWWQLDDERSRPETPEETRSEYETRRRLATESALAREREKSEVGRWNDVVLGRARSRVSVDPSGALSDLAELDPRETSWLRPARLLASRAAQSDIVLHAFDAGVGVVRRLWVDDQGGVVVLGERGMARRSEGDQAFADPVDAEMADVSPGGSSRVWVGSDGSLWYQHEETVQRVRGLERPEQVAVAVDGRWLAAANRRAVVLWSVDALDAPLRRSLRHPLRTLMFAEEAFVGIDEKGGAWRFPVDVETTQGVASIDPSSEVIGYDPGTGALDVLDGSGRWEQVHFSPYRFTPVVEGQSFRSLARAMHTREVITVSDQGEVQLLSSDLNETRRLDPGADVVAISPWARWVAVARGEKVSLWRLAAPDVERLGIYDGAVSALDFSPDETMLAVGTTAGTARLWKVREDGHEVLGHLIGGIREMSFSPSGRYVAAVGGLGGATIWDVAGREPVTAVSALGPIRSALVWAPDEEALGLHACDSPRRCRVVVHSLRRGERIASTRLGPPVRWFSLSSGDHRFLVVHDGSAVLHRPDRSDAVAPPWAELPSRILACRFDDRGLWLATKDELRVRLWLWEPDEERITEVEERQVVEGLASDEHGSVLIRGARDELWTPGASLVLPVRGVPEVVERFSTSPDGQLALFFEPDGGGTLVHLETGVSRRFGPLGARTAWSGGTMLADAPSYSLVRLWRDPTPAHPAAFLGWLRTMSDANALEN